MARLRLIESVAKDISSDFASRLKIDKSKETKMLLSFSKMIAKEVVKQLLKEWERNPGAVKAILTNTTEDGRLSKKLKKAEDKLTKIVQKGLRDSGENSDEDETKGTRTKFQNLKYAQPKYKNVESVLKYVESKDEKAGGVKLVIMNFND